MGFEILGPLAWGLCAAAGIPYSIGPCGRDTNDGVCRRPVGHTYSCSVASDDECGRVIPGNGVCTLGRDHSSGHLFQKWKGVAGNGGIRTPPAAQPQETWTIVPNPGTVQMLQRAARRQKWQRRLVWAVVLGAIYLGYNWWNVQAGRAVGKCVAGDISDPSGTAHEVDCSNSTLKNASDGTTVVVAQVAHAGPCASDGGGYATAPVTLSSGPFSKTSDVCIRIH